MVRQHETRCIHQRRGLQTGFSTKIFAGAPLVLLFSTVLRTGCVRRSGKVLPA